MRIFIKTRDEIASEIANRVLDLVKNKPNCVLGLATGSSPLMTYQKIIEGSKEQNISFSEVTSFNLDEYKDNNDVTQSYRYFMNTNLFDHIDIKKENTNFPSEENYSRYDKMIEEKGGVDFQILGLGSDGHIAFNEPNTPFDSLTHIAKLDESTIKDNSRFFKSIDDVPTEAITMGLQSIMRSKEIVLIATGKNKAEAVRRMIFTNDISCPASILNGHNNVTIYVDEEAASLIK